MTSVDPGPVDPEKPGDGTRRTHLASERTLLAWWRSGLAAMAVALAVGRLLPALLRSSRIPFALLGLGFASLSLAFIVYGTARQRRVDRAIDEGTFPSLDAWVVMGLATLMAILAVSTILLVLTAL
jgi:uncharacterized membrane protein YidH (DUF202 family)